MRKFKVAKSITNRDNEIFNIYLKDISRYPLLNADEEKELGRKIREGDKKAKDKLVRSNLRFVISVAKQYQGQGLDLMDLIEAGNEGLITSAEKFDPDRGYKFISYAVWWIKQSIIQALSVNSRMIKLPISQSSKLIKIIKEIYKFEQTYQRKPSNEELGKILDINPNKINGILSSNAKVVSVETPISGEDEACLLDIIPNENAQLSDNLTSKSDKETIIHELLNSLPIRDRDIIVLSYGLLGVQPLPYDEIGKLFGVTGERVRQLHLNIIKNIKKNNLELIKELL